MGQLSRYKFNIHAIIILVIFTLLLTSCASKDPVKPKISAKNEKSNTSVMSGENSWKLPIKIPSGEFYKVAGWASNEQFVYITNQGQTSNVYLYQLSTGKSELIYQSDSPIVTAQISPSQKYILVQSSPTSYEGIVTIIDLKGKVKRQETIACYELAFEWNPYNENEIIVEKFNEDWTFALYLLKINSEPMIQLDLPQPFTKWLADSRLAYLKWDENNPKLFAPLAVKDLNTGEEKTLFTEVMQISTFKNLLMTITVEKKDQSEAVYSFYNKELEKVYMFSIPQLSKYSDWLVPFYDYSEKKGQFITLEPKTSGEADTYMDGFNLVSYKLQPANKKTILEGLKNEPLSFSPSGEFLLYGNSFEKIISVNTKKIYALTKE
ncbi:hypothetical protein [Bacillus sp. JJ1764]|uniref:YqgU-like beta propeller domain-containing protein n=1 Tax=Bacillus sp. JJ1764 TaxID=3122964 RepID=UPI002FFFE81D